MVPELGLKSRRRSQLRMNPKGINNRLLAEIKILLVGALQCPAVIDRPSFSHLWRTFGSPQFLFISHFRDHSKLRKGLMS
jgi:hypothetical protein